MHQHFHSMDLLAMIVIKYALFQVARVVLVCTQTVIAVIFALMWPLVFHMHFKPLAQQHVLIHIQCHIQQDGKGESAESQHHVHVVVEENVDDAVHDVPCDNIMFEKYHCNIKINKILKI